MSRLYQNLIKAAKRQKNQSAALRKAVAAIESHMEDTWRREIVELARDYAEDEGNIEFDGHSCVAESEGNGAYVQAWVWVPFFGTTLDKEKD